jgi:hypothetical protein
MRKYSFSNKKLYYREKNRIETMLLIMVDGKAIGVGHPYRGEIQSLTETKCMRINIVYYNSRVMETEYLGSLEH